MVTESGENEGSGHKSTLYPIGYPKRHCTVRIAFFCVFALAAWSCRVSKKSEQVQTSKVFDVIHVRDSIIRIPGSEVGVNLQYHQLLHLFDSLQKAGKKPQLQFADPRGNNRLRLTALPGGQIRAECTTADSLLRIVLKDRHRSEVETSTSNTVTTRLPWWFWPVAIAASIVLILMFLAMLYLFFKR